MRKIADFCKSGIRNYSTPSQLYDMKLRRGELKFDQKQVDVVKIMDRYATDIKNGVISKNLYIYGGVGTGKTMMMDLLFESVTWTTKKKRTHFNKFMLGFHSKMHQLRKENPNKDHLPTVVEQILTESSFLCFDEFQVTDIADAMILKRLFEGLIDKGAHLVMTSNRKPQDLYYNGINRSVFLPFIDLLVTKSLVIDMEEGNDYRLSGHKTTNVYITPPSNIKIDEIFNVLTHGEVAEPDYIEMKGRNITVPHAARGVARFNFSNLCLAQLSAQDYIKLCETYHTIIVEEIPYFNLNMRDVLRRFILLIDEMYQHRVKLICSAYDKPENLLLESKTKSEYDSIDEVFAFDRTISRLNEMQTKEYLQSHRIRSASASTTQSTK